MNIQMLMDNTNMVVRQRGLTECVICALYEYIDVNG